MTGRTLARITRGPGPDPHAHMYNLIAKEGVVLSLAGQGGWKTRVWFPKISKLGENGDNLGKQLLTTETKDTTETKLLIPDGRYQKAPADQDVEKGTIANG